VNRGTARVVLKLDLRCLGCQGWACGELVKFGRELVNPVCSRSKRTGGAINYWLVASCGVRMLGEGGTKACVKDDKGVLYTLGQPDDALVFEFITKFPHLELKHGCVEQLEIHLKTRYTCVSELDKIVRGFLLSQANEMYLGRQGFILPNVGMIKWMKLNFESDEPAKNIQNINEMMDVIKVKLIPSRCNECT
jgi:hypothetical protein